METQTWVRWSGAEIAYCRRLRGKIRGTATNGVASRSDIQAPQHNLDQLHLGMVSVVEELRAEARRADPPAPTLNSAEE